MQAQPPLGAHWDGQGTRFTLYSGRAEQVELCLYDGSGTVQASREVDRIRLEQGPAGRWTTYAAGVGPGQLYGYRINGPYRPERGLWFNPAKLLVDPYAQALAGKLRDAPEIFAYRLGQPLAYKASDGRDSAPFVPRSVVVDPGFDWQGVQRPLRPWSETVIYECHVKGLTQLHQTIPPEQRGRYLGLAHPAVIEHLLALGVTAVELLPVHHRASETFLLSRGFENYWGYSTLGFFAPDARFASGDRGQQVSEFKTMVRELHRAGIEVILDVVYNHTCEGDQQGPTLSWRGIDNRAYYHLGREDPRFSADYTGCGNTILATGPRGLALVMDSLRFWAEEMQVDGFRFDLASALLRDKDGVVRPECFYPVASQDPALAGLKLIAEPWDVGPGGYRLGHCPPGWAEWNDQYRDTLRRYWRGDPGQLGSLASRLGGSSDVFMGDRQRGPLASVNYVACHDGFTLQDVVSYERKHNERNGEHNRDGSDANWSRNWGVEGPSQDPDVQARRAAVQKSLLGSLAFSQGVPMINMGDELGRTQQGNNNAYCQDNELSWLDWSQLEQRQDLLLFAQRAFQLRREHPLLRRTRWFRGQPRPSSPTGKDLTWLRAGGGEMTEADWRRGDRRALGMFLDARPDRPSEPGDEALLLLVNSGETLVRFALPPAPGGAWHLLLSSADGAELRQRRAADLPAHCLILLSGGRPT